jgi:hypothetical protein
MPVYPGIKGGSIDMALSENEYYMSIPQFHPMDDQHIFQLPYLAIFSYIFSGCSTCSDKHTYNNNINNNSSNYSK